MKIDLHCHTKKTKIGDSNKRNVAKHLFATKIKESNVGIVAITNHNVFDIEQFDLFQEELNIKEINSLLLPGIELNAFFKDFRFHILVIVDEKNKNEFNTLINELFLNKDIETFEIDIISLFEFFKSISCFYIVHFHGKENAMNENVFKEIKPFIEKEKINFYVEPNFNLETIKILINNNIKSLIGTDNKKDWDEYEKNLFFQVSWKIKSFKDLIDSLNENYLSFVSKLVSEEENGSKEIEITPFSKKENSLKFSFFNKNLTVFLGDKGTGKSLIFEALKENFIKERRIISCYPKESFIKMNKNISFLDEVQKTTLPDVLNFGFDDLKIEIESIKNFSLTTPVDLNIFFNFFKKEVHNNIMKKLNIQNTPIKNFNLETKENNIMSDINYYKNVFLNLNKIKIDLYLEPEDLSKIKNSLNTLSKNLNKEYHKIKYEFKKFTFINKTIECFIETIQNNTDKLVKPNKTGLFDYWGKTYNLKRNIKKLLKNLELKSTHNTLKKINVFGDKDLELKEFIFAPIKENNLFDSKLERLVLYNTKYKVTDIQKIYKNLKKLDDSNWKNSDFKEFKSSINEVFQNFFKIDDFLSHTIQLYDNKTNSIYKPSTGEEKILQIANVLENDSDIYLLDEIEVNLGNFFITSFLIPKITSLLNKGKTIFISTHNSNLAITMNPTKLILRKFENQKYKTYQGVKYFDKLFNVDDENDFLIWKYESLNLLEGGKEYFDKRIKIYENN